MSIYIHIFSPLRQKRQIWWKIFLYLLSFSYYLPAYFWWWVIARACLRATGLYPHYLCRSHSCRGRMMRWASLILSLPRHCYRFHAKVTSLLQCLARRRCHARSSIFKAIIYWYCQPYRAQQRYHLCRLMPSATTAITLFQSRAAKPHTCLSFLKYHYQLHYRRSSIDAAADINELYYSSELARLPRLLILRFTTLLRRGAADDDEMTRCLFLSPVYHYR